MENTTQHPVKPEVDLRDMLRQYLVKRALRLMNDSAMRRKSAVESGLIDEYINRVRRSVSSFYGHLPAGHNAPVVESKIVSAHVKHGFRIENVLFDSFPGYQVNATIYIPAEYEPPYPAIVVPIGHSGKQFSSYQIPCQLFAKSGYMAIVFDCPGQSGEKQPGNDHFKDGVRCYVTGDTSSSFFIADALRCIDYLESRNDVDTSIGVAMTGVSGGGTTTTICAILDDRIRVSGPSCCLSPLSASDIRDCYAGCPETHQFGRYSEMIDETDLLAAACPKPTLVMAGAKDVVFLENQTRKIVEEAGAIYSAAGYTDHLQLFVDKCDHEYSINMASEFVKFANKWLVGKQIYRDEINVNDLKMLEYDEIRCWPDTSVNMQTVTLDKANQLKKSRMKDKIRESAVEMAGTINSTPCSSLGEKFLTWTHYWQQGMLYPESEIEIPVTILQPETTPSPLILHFDDIGRNRLIAGTDGLLTGAAGFLSESTQLSGIISADLRGWGDTSPCLYAYEMAPWGSTDRYTAYASAALGDPIMMMRVRDALSVLSFAQTLDWVDAKKIVITGCGLGGIVALHAAVISNEPCAVVIWDSLYSIQNLLEAQDYIWPADIFIPNMLQHYDLPELAEAAHCPVCVINPLDANKNPYISSKNKLENTNYIYTSSVTNKRKQIQDSITSFFG